MLFTTEGIVLNCIKYGESSAIVTIYTKNYGRQTYIINSVRNKRSTTSKGILQPLFLIDLVAYYKDSRNIQRVKEIKNYPVFQNIPFDVSKSTQAIFIAEILNKTLHEQESYPELFSFMKNAFLLFDLTEGPTANFHLYFLLHLTEYLGFLPGLQKKDYKGWFDLKRGTTVPLKPIHPFYANKEATIALCNLFTLKIKELDQLRISRNLRGYLTSKLVEYYQLHFEHLGEIKSLKVLQEVFS